jgi:hypothetical protein
MPSSARIRWLTMRRWHPLLRVEARLPPPRGQALRRHHHPASQLRTARCAITSPSPLPALQSALRVSASVDHPAEYQYRRYKSAADAAGGIPSFAFAFEYGASVPSYGQLHPLTDLTYKYRWRSSPILSAPSWGHQSSYLPPRQQYPFHSIDQWRWETRECARRRAERETERSSHGGEFYPVSYAVQAAC